MGRKMLLTILMVTLLIITPLLGVLIQGDTVESFLHLPPKTEYVDHGAFSMLFFIVILALGALAVIPFVYKIIKSQPGTDPSKTIHKKFPPWGWVGVVLLVGGWIVAWTRFEWASQIQIFTFTPIWLGYVVLINAFLYMRTGASLITHAARYLLLLFVVSAVFWWYYEYLNQFTDNWYYVGLDHLTDFQYFLYATFPFATVLPAVISTWFLLRSFPRLSAGLENFGALPVMQKNRFWWIMLAIGVLTLSVTYLYPRYLFPFMWLSPMLIIASVITLGGGKTIISNAASGNWKDLFLLAVAALICGFFWEMWNYYSLTKWEYSVPFVHRYLIFEMPVLGYLGYLPFGIQCGLIGIYISKISETDMVFYPYTINK
ncbi:MAG: hypothetical protein ACLFS0_08890 [Bacteroidales bacterium]